MKYSLNLGRPFGIRIAVHWTFLLLILWVVAVNVRQGGDTAQVVYSVLFIVALFVCVTLHELGHSLAARKYGIETRSITLLPIGGMANIDEMPEKPKQEVVVTLSGLLVNVAIALLLWIVISLAPGLRMDTAFEAINSQNFLVMLMIVNLVIVGFNLIPAFPMDGGRILRALLAMRFDRLKATRIAMMAGQVFGVIFAAIGLFINPFLFIIGVFVVIGARMEYTQVKYRSMLVDKKARDIVMEEYTVFGPDQPLQSAVEKLLKSTQSGFLVKGEEGIMGILTKNDIIRGLSSLGEEAAIRKAMTREFKHVKAGTFFR